MAQLKILLVGAGKMGTALLAGWKNAAIDFTADILTPHPQDELKTYAAHLFTAADQVTAIYDVIVLAVKPQILQSVLPSLKSAIAADTILLSIITGKSLATIRALSGSEATVIRTMPNTPSLIGQGMTACIADASATNAQKETAACLMQAVGDVIWLDDEEQMHAVTGLSGSGPAYIFALIEAMQKAGEANGLSTELSLKLAIKTVQGAGALAASSDKSPTQLREQVTSPNGTTAAALAVLQGNQGLDELITAAITAATKRSRELA